MGDAEDRRRRQAFREGERVDGSKCRRMVASVSLPPSARESCRKWRCEGRRILFFFSMFSHVLTIFLLCACDGPPVLPVRSISVVR